MEWFELNRRQFMQFGVGAALASHGHVHAGSSNASLSVLEKPIAQWDPHLVLALANEFADHDLTAWTGSTRMCGNLPSGQLHRLRSLLGEHGHIQSMFSDGGDAWVTLTLQSPALMRVIQEGAHLFKDHIWGAPWSHPMRARGPSERPNGVASHPELEEVGEAAWSSGAGGRQRVLVIDHGFPMAHLRRQRIAHLHRFSPSTNHRRSSGAVAYSHGSQVLGLLVQGMDGDGPRPIAPLLLHELPDEILSSMPHAALWPEVVDAVMWALSQSPRGIEWIVLLSMVSTDADRHPQSFISRCARSLTAHAHSRGVRLTWVMAAGNSHADRQSLALVADAHRPVAVHWHLPVQNVRPSFLTCWHDAAMGPPGIQVRPPGGTWSDSMTPMSMATRVHGAYDRAETVLRLPPTAAWTATEALACSGDWGLRFVFQKGGPFHLHLSMMTSSSQGLMRQAHLTAATDEPSAVSEPISISGLIPFLPDVMVAQTLSPNAVLSRIESPSHGQLSAYCGRWPQTSVRGDTRTIGFKVDASPVRRGVLTWSRNGHRIHRVTGTSMAVPLAARWLMGLD